MAFADYSERLYSACSKSTYTPLTDRRETDMTIQERVVGSVTVLDLEGKMVLGDGDTLLKDKIHSLALQELQNIVLNLGRVSYMDSSGLESLDASFVTA